MALAVVHPEERGRNVWAGDERAGLRTTRTRRSPALRDLSCLLNRVGGAGGRRHGWTRYRCCAGAWGGVTASGGLAAGSAVSGGDPELAFVDGVSTRMLLAPVASNRVNG